MSRVDTPSIEALDRTLLFQLENSPLAFIHWGEDFKITRWSKRAEELFGWSASEVTGRHPKDFHFVHPEDLDGVQNVIERMCAGHKGGITYRNRNLTKNGAVVECEWFNSVATDDSGRYLSGLSLVLDITARQSEEVQRIQSLTGLPYPKFKEIAEAKALAESQLQLALECGHSATFEYTLEKTPEIRVSGNHHRLFGLPNPIENWSFESFFDRVHPDDREAVKRLATQIIRGEHDGYEAEYRIIWPDGSVHWLSEKGQRLRVNDKLRLMGAFTDITRLKETELRLQEAIEIRDEFISVAAHELRTPMTSSQLALETLNRMVSRASIEELPWEKVKRLLENALHQTVRLGTLVNRLLDVSKMRRGKLEIHPRNCDLAEIVRRGLETLEPEARDGGTRIDFDLEPGVTGQWDRDRIEQVVLNLLSNALKYAPGAPVQARVFRQGDEAVLEVKDQGPGLSDREHERVFERYERRGDDSGIAGMGLGLYISDQLVRAHHGKIELESQPGHGATFRVRLPRLGN